MSKIGNHDELLTVGQLNNIAKNLLEGHLANVKVVAEISNLSIPSSGHMYFTLKDDSGSVRCAFFKGKQLGLNFKPKDGDQCVVNAQVSLYVPRGDYQLIVHSIEPFGEGNLMAAFEKLKIKLQNEGLFDSDHKQDIPIKPMHIGIITSASTAAYQDIFTCLARRAPFANVTLVPATVQGDKSPRELIAALNSIELFNLTSTQPIDVVILARGGGSIEDLWAFNNEDLAYAIYQFSVPIVSGVGHEIDFTIADFVADLRAPTPTAAAELVSQGMFELADKLEDMKILLVKEIKNLIQDKKHSLLELNSRIKNPKDLLKSWSQMIDLHEIKIVNHIKKTLLIINNRLKNNEQALVSLSPINIVAALKNKIRENASLLRRLMKTNLKDFSNETFVLKEKIEALNPLAILQRGFSVTFDANGKIIKNAKEVRAHDLIRTKLAGGEIISKINETD